MLRFKKEDGSAFPDLKEIVLADIMTERTTTQCISEGAPLLSFTIEQGVIDPSEKKTNKRDFLTKDMANKKYSLVEYNDIIYNPSNIIFGAINRNKFKRGVVSPIYAIFETSELPEYVELLVCNRRFINRSLKYLEGTVIKLRSLKPDDFLKLKVSLPCREEQEKIAKFFANIDAKIKQQEEIIADYETLKVDLSKKIFSRQLKFKDAEGKAFPEWSKSSFDAVFEMLQNNTYSRDMLNYEKGTALNVHYGDVLVKFGSFVDVQKTQLPFINEDISIAKFSMDSYLCNGDVVIADTAEDASVAKATEIFGIKDEIILAGLHTIPCRPKIKFMPKFLGYYINSEEYHKQILPLIQGVKVSSVSKSNIVKTIIEIPCMEEQVKIAEFLSNIDAKIEVEKAILEDWKELRKGLLQQMFV